jgi:signal transduction histidine kinase
MLENLKIAVRRQKKLIFIFFLTIFIPAITLSIFGVIAIRNEKFRRAEQVENEHRRAAEFLRSQISSQLKDLESTLFHYSQSPTVVEQDLTGIAGTAESVLTGQDIMEEIILAYKDGTIEYPLFSPTKITYSPAVLAPLSTAQREQLKRAEENEFKLKRLRTAISGYNRLCESLSHGSLRAQMLHNIARCFSKLNDYNNAIELYSQVISQYPDSASASGVPLMLLSRLQIIDCHVKLGNTEEVLTAALSLYTDLLDKSWNLNVDQYRTYAGLTSEKIQTALSDNKNTVSFVREREEFKKLQERHRHRSQRWQVVRNMKTHILPELMRRIIERNSVETSPQTYVAQVDGQEYKMLAVPILNVSADEVLGLLGVKLDEEYLIENLLSRNIREMRFSEKTNIAISDLAGTLLLGTKPSDYQAPSVTELFEGNFPPWRMQFYRGEAAGSGILSIRRSFYFWTILTLIIILIFGSILIMRTIAHEMDVLKIKSDFVSSVSHEFKTPLTSIKALVERLQDGKVKDDEKLNQYYSVISQDTEKLSRLVKNILDFSKIEEGKVEYNRVETELSQWVVQQVESFQQNELAKNARIKCDVAQNIPLVKIDREAMSQVIVNLLGNAVKFSPDELEIGVFLKSTDDSIVLEVNDQGIGIPQDEIDKIFDKFYQGRSAQKLTVKGTGLGLTLVKRIVEAHGGTIEVKSRVGKGSTFTLTFSLKSM